VLLVLAATLLWKVGNRQSAAAITFSRADASSGMTHVPAPGATELYLRGRYYWNLRTADGLAKAIDSYTQAIVTDPSYAEAYAGLAEAYDLLPQFGQADLGDSLRKAEHAADRAIALNPNLAAAHRAKAFALYYWDWDIAGSDAEFKRALELDPNSSQTHQWYAGTLECRSEGAKAIVQIDEALQLDPTSPAIATDAALLHADFGDFKSGVKALKEIEQTQPTLSSPAEFLRDLDFATGDFPAYIEEARRFASITHAPDAVALANAVAQGWARAGRTGLLEARAEALRAAFDKGTGSGFLLGENLLLLGRRQDGLVYFRASFDRHDDRLLQLAAFDDYPWVREISSDPGYAALFAKVRLRVRDVTPAQPEQARVSERLPQ
jgi:tetratricopeptide (TPR) repeat protein